MIRFGFRGSTHSLCPEGVRGEGGQFIQAERTAGCTQDYEEKDSMHP